MGERRRERRRERGAERGGERGVERGRVERSGERGVGSGEWGMEIYTLKSRRVNFRSQNDVNQSNVAYRFSHM